MKTEIIKAGNRNAIPRAADVLARGGIIVYPTDTSYGIGADATNDKAVKKIIGLKKRGAGKKILVAFCNLKMARQYFVINKKTELLANAFMPGPFSLGDVEKRSGGVAGFRIPNHLFVLKLVRKLGKPITTTSANISGKKPAYKIADVGNIFNGKVDLIIDGGNLAERKTSTLYSVLTDKIVREGPISEKRIREALGL